MAIIQIIILQFVCQMALGLTSLEVIHLGIIKCFLMETRGLGLTKTHVEKRVTRFSS